MSKVAVMVADGTEPVEFIAPMDVMRRAGIEVCLVSAHDRLEISTAQEIEVVANAKASDIRFEDYDMIVVPGGNVGVENLSKCDELLEALKQFSLQGKWIASICAGPTILADLHLLDGYKATCYPGCQTNFPEGTYQPNGVYTDRNLITASGPAYALEFGRAIAAALAGKQVADEVASGMLF